MMDPTGQEQTIKRIATGIGIAAAMLVSPSVTAAANVTAQANPQRVTAEVATVQVAKAHRAYAAKHVVMVHRVQVANVHTISLRHAQSR